MSTIAHPVLLIMAQWLASIIIKTGAMICTFSDNSKLLCLNLNKKTRKMTINSISVGSFSNIICIFALSNVNEYVKAEYHHRITNSIKIGSEQNGTVRIGDFLASIHNWLYFCSAFETQMLNIEY